jgi:prepilin-type processing-associated H-X9-DG protein
LIALLVPAVQKVRAAAARTQCGNNLKQQGLALQSYLGTNKCFPPAYKTPVVATLTVAPGWGWGTLILPFVDQQPIYSELSPDSTLFGGGAANPFTTPTVLMQTPLDVYRCPANLAPDQNAGRYNFENSNMPVAQITDGTSNTLAIGECTYDQDGALKRNAAIWVGMTGNTQAAASPPIGARISDVMWWLDTASNTNVGNAGTNYINGTSPQAFSSFHSGGANFAYCDGTVRFMTDDIASMTTMKYLAGRNDGQTVDPDGF